MRIAIFAPLVNLDPTYSIAAVAHSQAHILKAAGHDLTVIVYEGFQDREYLPAGAAVKLVRRPGPGQGAEDYAPAAAPLLVNELEGVDCCITHDIAYLQDYRPLGEAVRLAARSLPRLRWLHWCHSGPFARDDPSVSDPAFYESIPNSLYITVSRTFVEGFEGLYQAPKGTVKAVHNWLDPMRVVAFHPLAVEVYEWMRLWEADFVAVYPTRMAEAKQINKAIKLMGTLHRKHGPAKLIICASHTKGEEPESLAKSLRELARNEGLADKDFLIVADFTSRWSEETGVDLGWGVPPQAVSNLLGLSDLFMMPSMAEACSLATLEAAFARNLIVYNSDLPNVGEFMGDEIASGLRARGLAFPFGTDNTADSDGGPEWYERHAERIVEAQRRDQCMSFFKHVRKEHSPWWIYENELRPILYESGSVD